MTRSLLMMVLVACEGSNAAAPPPAAKQVVADANVGYDVRRLRPRDGEPLGSMFDRMRGEAVAEGKHVAVLFSADWCEPCRDLALELGNTHPASSIGSFRVLELVEEDWEGATRIGEFNALRRRWYAPISTYPVFLVLDENGNKIEEMKEAIDRLKGAGIEPSLANWFADIAAGGGPKSSGA
jgi:thiol-disulfide isomerase/thioredoxin